MKFFPYNVRKHMFWHVPVSIATLAIGIYLALICIVPSFVPDHHQILTDGMIYIFIPYFILVLIGSPIFTLWYYSNLESKKEFCEHSSKQNYE